MPFLGGLLLNCLVCRCLNLGGPFLGVTGPPVTLVADRTSALGGSRFMARLVEMLWRPLALDFLTLGAGGRPGQGSPSALLLLMPLSGLSPPEQREP